MLLASTATISHGVSQAWDAAEGYVCVGGPTADRVCVDVCGPSYYQWPHGCPNQGHNLQPCWYPKAMGPPEPWWRLELWCRPGPGCCQGSCIGTGPSRSQGLSWCPWLLLPLKEMWMPGGWSVTWDHVGIWRLPGARAIFIWMTCTATIVTCGPEVLPRHMSEPLILQNLGSVLMSTGPGIVIWSCPPVVSHLTWVLGT